MLDWIPAQSKLFFGLSGFTVHEFKSCKGNAQNVFMWLCQFLQLTNQCDTKIWLQSKDPVITNISILKTFSSVLIFSRSQLVTMLLI